MKQRRWAIRPDNGEADWQDPMARYLRVKYDLSADGAIPALGVLRRLREWGVELTPEIVANVFNREGETWEDQGAKLARQRARFYPRGSVVYYMRIGNRVKIGFSTNLSERLKTFTPEELLAVEPGDIALERSRQARFNALWTHAEWFRYEGELVEWVEELQRRAG